MRKRELRDKVSRQEAHRGVLMDKLGEMHDLLAASEKERQLLERMLDLSLKPAERST